MKVIKIGGGCLAGRKVIGHIINLIEERCRGQIIVVSALKDVTNLLIGGMASALEAEENIPNIINRIKTRHMNVGRFLIPDQSALKDYYKDLNKTILKLERLYYGLNFTREITPRMHDMISCFGERLSAQLLTTVLRNRNVQTAYRMPHKIGLVTDGKFGDATANLEKTERNFQEHLKPILNKKMILFIPGFFGISEEGDITTFGRGGSDYSAAVVATAVNAERLEIWKDTEGFMSADPRCVPEAQLIPVLSYEEAAELAYFGAKILHPRSVEPIRAKKLDIVIKNTLNPDAGGSRITAVSPRSENIIKSVAHDTDIGILKVYGSGVGARPGIFATVAGQLSESGINIKSVVTSQTCISLLLTQKDLEPGRLALNKLKSKPFRKIEVNNDIALISIVGDGLIHREGIASRCFSAVAACHVNVEMISFGPSPAALYFITQKKDLTSAVVAIHSTFFATPRCEPL